MSWIFPSKKSSTKVEKHMQYQETRSVWGNIFSLRSTQVEAFFNATYSFVFRGFHKKGRLLNSKFIILI